MNQLQRSIKWFSNRLFITCMLMGFCLTAYAQTTETAGSKSRIPSKNARKTTADRLAAERRKQAQSLLITLASEARSFRDQRLRARSLARIADALWEADSEQSRSFFIKSWEAAETADASTSDTVGEASSDVRKEVMVLIAKRDRVLAEDFLQRLKAQEETKSKPTSEASLWDLPTALQQRLDLAETLLRSGDVRRALEFADPVLGNVTISTLDFLTVLREKDSVAADSRYTRMLQQSSSNPLTDANTVSLLSSYLFTPRMYVIFNREGNADASWMRTTYPPANVSAQLRLLFFQTASAVLLRPLPPTDQDNTTTGVSGKFMVVRRLMPLFEQHAPEPLTDYMRAQYEALNSLVSNRVREAEKEWVDRGIAPEKTLTEQMQPLLDQVERVSTSYERDAIYFKLALMSLSKDDHDARNYVNKIADSEFRKQAQRWVDWGLAVRAIKKKSVEIALELACTAELSNIQRVWILTQSAKLLATVDSERALSLLDQATSETRRIESSQERPRALLAIANAVLLVEPARVWETLFEVVKAANSSEGFNGDDGMLPLSINNKQQILSRRFDYIPEFEMKGIFTEIAVKDFDRAVQLAHGFQGEAARTNATIAICQSVLKGRRESIVLQNATSHD
jgi:hypothetical protein